MNEKSFKKGFGIGIITLTSVIVIDNLMRDNVTKPSNRRVRTLYFTSFISTVAASIIADSYEK